MATKVGNTTNNINMSGKRKSSDVSSKRKPTSQAHKFPGKKPLPKPTHVGHFMMMLLMKICRMILFVDTSVKIGVYLIGVMMGSVICDLFVVPKTFMADKRNPLNTYFVKFGWGWTFTFVGAYIFMTSLVYSCNNISRICQHVLRLAVGTFMWYVCTKFFMHIETVVGICTHSGHGDKSACMDAGKKWLGFDISGHVFLEMHCLLIISEEVKTFKEWKKLGLILDDEDLKDKRKLSEDDISQARMNYKTLTPYIKIIVVCLAIIFVLFEFMLLISTIYRFHTLSQKVTASFIAVIDWFLCYNILYRSGNPFPFMPVMPGESPLNFM